MLWLIGAYPQVSISSPNTEQASECLPDCQCKYCSCLFIIINNIIFWTEPRVDPLDIFIDYGCAFCTKCFALWIF